MMIIIIIVYSHTWNHVETIPHTCEMDYKATSDADNINKAINIFRINC